MPCPGFILQLYTSSECSILQFLGHSDTDFYTPYSVILFLPLGINTSLLFNFFISLSLKLSHCFVLSFIFHHVSAPCLGHYICGMALAECLVNSEILLWEVKGPLSSRAEEQISQLTFLHCIHRSHHGRAQFGSY